MNEDKGIMKVEAMLPTDFDGIFRFTNGSDEEFIGIWGGKEYRFPPMSTSPIIIPDHSPLQIQHIRKKFAKDWAEREFFKSKQYETFRSQEGSSNNRTMSGIHQAGTYTLTELTPFIQKCLEPLPISSAVVTEAPRVEMENMISRDPKDGKLNTAPASSDADLENLAKGKVSLKEKAGIQ